MLQMLIIVVILGGVAFGIMSMISSGLKGQKSVSQNFDFDLLRNNVQWIFQSDAQCAQAFKDSAGHEAKFGPSGSNISRIMNSRNGTLIVEKDGDYGSGLKITDIRLEYKKTPAGTNAPTTFNNLNKLTLHWVRLVIEADRGMAYGGLKSNTNSAFEFGVYTDAGNKIVGCLTPGSEDDSLAHRFLWIDKSKNCSDISVVGTSYSNYIDTYLEDDADDGHDLNENSDSGNGELKLCASGFNNATDIGWFVNACPSGYKDTGVIDDGPTSHNLKHKDDNGGPYYHWCFKGISDVEWTGTCKPGWSPVRLTDDGEADGHKVFEGSDQAGGFQLCVK